MLILRLIKLQCYMNDFCLRKTFLLKLNSLSNKTNISDNPRGLRDKT